jgi:WD repeat and SOF domain-containing protein 1
MKVKVLNRDPKDYLKTRVGDLPKLPRNVDPVLHPHAAQREYTAALNAVKLERVFAKPFVGSLDGKSKILHTFMS